MLVVDGEKHKIVLRSEENILEEYTLEELRKMSDIDLEDFLIRIHEDGYDIGYDDGKYQKD